MTPVVIVATLGVSYDRIAVATYYGRVANAPTVYCSSSGTTQHCNTYQCEEDCDCLHCITTTDSVLLHELLETCYMMSVTGLMVAVTW